MHCRGPATTSVSHEAFLGRGVGGVGARVGEPLVAVLALERLLPRVDPLVLLQVMLELESLAAVATFEFSQVRAVLVVGHVALQLVEGGELLGAHGARDVGVLRVVGAHVPLEGGEGGEVAATVAGDVGGRLEAGDSVQVGDRVGDREAGVGQQGRREWTKLVEVVQPS